MLRAGLGIDGAKLRALGLATVRLAVLPCTAEALSIAALSGPLLGLPLAWGGTLGFVIAAVSPAVVVPGMLDLGARGYGVAKGVPTMVVAAASFDDVLAIAAFGICLTLAAGGEASALAPGVQASNVGANQSFTANTSLAAVVPPMSSGGADVPLAWLVLSPFVELLAGGRARASVRVCERARGCASERASVRARKSMRSHA